MKQDEHFGTIGLKIGDRLRFRHDLSVTAVISSGDGTPNNGGILVAYENGQEPGLFSIRLMTRRLLGGDLPEGLDVWECWEYGNQSLREMLNERQAQGLKSFVIQLDV